MEKLKAYLQVVRWSNLIMLLILVWTLNQWVAVPLLNKAFFGAVLPWWIIVLLMASTVFLAAGGYVINDYFDVKIDRINRPDRVLVTTIISKQQAIRTHQVLSILGTAMGLVVAWWSRSWSLALVMLVVPGLLWFYSSTYKRQFIIGNIIIAFLSALPPLIIAMTTIGAMRRQYGNLFDVMQDSPIGRSLYIWLGGFALFAFLITLMREVIKDMEDQQGDRELECHTLPVRMGDWGAKWIVTIIGLVTIALIVWLVFWVIPFPHTWDHLSLRYTLFGILTPLVGSLILMWAAKIPSDYHLAQGVMKFTMLMGILYSFVIERSL